MEPWAISLAMAAFFADTAEARTMLVRRAALAGTRLAASWLVAAPGRWVTHEERIAREAILSTR